MEQGVSISHDWIYQYVYADKHSGGDLFVSALPEATPQALWQLRPARVYPQPGLD
jgi:hypothetical protein